jgi:hypothetical protein
MIWPTCSCCAVAAADWRTRTPPGPAHGFPRYPLEGLGAGVDTKKWICGLYTQPQCHAL